MPAVGVGISPFFGRLTPSEAVAYYTRVKAGSGTIDDFSALVGLTLDYQRIASLNPSLYTFASGRKAGTQYSLTPTDGSGDFSVTRSGTTGMELNAQGFWQPVGENVPRYDYVSGVPMINIEEARTNLISRYKSFAHTDWTKSGASIQGDPNTAGAEKVVNGGFDTDTGWTKGVGHAISGGTLNINTGSATFTYQLLTSVINNLLKVEFTVSNYVSGGVSVYVGNTAVQSYTANGSYVRYLFPTADSNVYIQASSGAGFIGSVDNISVKPVTGYASPFVDSSGVNLMSGYKLVEGTNNGAHYMRPVSGISIATGQKTASIFAKYDGTRRWLLMTDDNVGSASNGFFDLQNGIVGSGSVTKKITAYGNGWYRCEIMYTSSVNALPSCYLANSDGSVLYLGDGTSGILIAHAQLEAGATASSPIGGAEGSTQTRNADAIVKTGASALIGQTEGTITLYCLFTGDSARDIVRFYNQGGTNTDFIAIGINATKQISARLRYNDGTNRNIDLVNPTAISVNTSYKITLKYKSGNTKLYVNDIEVASNTTVFAFSTILYGYIYSTQYVYGLGSFNLGYMYLTKSI